MSRAPLALVATLAGAALALAGGRGPAQQPADGPARAAVLEVLKKQQDDWNRGDVAAFLEGYWKSPELTFSGSSGTTRGWDGLLERYRKTYPDRAAMGQLEFAGLEFRPLGDQAMLVLGKWHLARPMGPVGGVFSLVWQRFPGGWRIVHDHTSAVPISEK